MKYSILLALIISSLILFSACTTPKTNNATNLTENAETTKTTPSEDASAESVQTDEEITQTNTIPFTLAEISSHNSADDCWLAVDGMIYDVTEFISNHPGGKAILNGCGKDASALFHGQPRHEQSGAENTLSQWKIGVLSE